MAHESGLRGADDPLKTIKLIAAFSVVLLVVLSAQAQGTFQNLNFESANIPGGTVGPFVPVSEAVPGWSAYFTSGGVNYPQSEVGYDFISLGGNDITLIDSKSGISPLQGNYSVMLYGGGNNPYYSASISQTGLIPSGDQTLLMDAEYANVAPVVAINGQAISMIPLQAFANYTVYGGTIPSVDVGADSTTISFTEAPLASGGLGILELDNISFSPNAVPEPSPWMLTGIGGFFLALRRWYLKR